MEDTYFDREYSIVFKDLEREEIGKIIKVFVIMQKGKESNPMKQEFITRMNTIVNNLMGNRLDYIPLLQLNDIRIDSSISGQCLIIVKLRGPIKQSN